MKVFFLVKTLILSHRLRDRNVAGLSTGGSRELRTAAAPASLKHFTDQNTRIILLSTQDLLGKHFISQVKNCSFHFLISDR